MEQNSSQKIDLEGYANWFSQLPGIVLVMNTNSEFVLSNNHTAKLFGYKNEESLQGLNAFGMRCPAVACAESFINQDKHVINTKEEITLLDIHAYADDQTRVLLTKKKPLYQANDITGVICHCTEIQSNTISKVSSILIGLDKKYHEKNSHNERSYFIGSIPQEQLLSKRELELLFYYVRGKTSKTIAKILNLSYRTVENYIDNIKNKLDLGSKEDLIEYSILNGYFSYIPEFILTQDLSIII